MQVMMISVALLCMLLARRPILRPAFWAGTLGGGIPANHSPAQLCLLGIWPVQSFNRLPCECLMGIASSELISYHSLIVRAVRETASVCLQRGTPAGKRTADSWQADGSVLM